MGVMVSEAFCDDASGARCGDTPFCICSYVRFAERGLSILAGGEDSVFVTGVNVGGPDAPVPVPYADMSSWA